MRKTQSILYNHSNENKVDSKIKNWVGRNFASYCKKKNGSSFCKTYSTPDTTCPLCTNLYPSDAIKISPHFIRLVIVTS